jgi:hypothetical protein
MGWPDGGRNRGNDLQRRLSRMVVGHHDRVAGPDFRFAAGVGLGHLRRAAHFVHVLAARLLLGSHTPVRNDASQYRRDSPVECQERSRHGHPTTHDGSLACATCRAQVIPVTTLGDLGLPLRDSDPPERAHIRLRRELLALRAEVQPLDLGRTSLGD